MGIGLFLFFFPLICYAENIEDSATNSSFDASNDLMSRYARKQILNGETTSIKKKKKQIYLEFPFDSEPYMSFSNFVLDGPTHVYSGFIETIYYRDKIKIKDMYYENNPVKTDKLGIYSTDLCFTSDDGVIYHYKNVPYLVSSNQSTIFFSEVNFDKESKTINGEIKIPASKSPCQIDLFYTDNDEYHYQGSSVNKKGRFKIELNREGIEGKMYLRASDGLGNYADAYDISKQGSTRYSIPKESLKAIEESYKTSKDKTNKDKTDRPLILNISSLIIILILIILLFLRLRVIRKRRKRK
ncbi:hypothetical protein RV09_GL000799 [Enterococcus moraviensis]|nr:hypothetical protein RV09_GL000799 [Enterococcus moraviensis]